MHHLVTVTEVADRLGVSVQRIRQLAQRADWPRPVAVLTTRRIRVWRTEDIERWVTEHRGVDVPEE